MVASRKDLYNGSSIAYGIYDFKSNVVNSSGVYRFPTKILEYIR